MMPIARLALTADRREQTSWDSELEAAMPGSLKDFENAVSQAARAPFEVKNPRTLYHYTTWAGAEGILTSREFWFTSHECTNDEAELVSADLPILLAVADVWPTADTRGRILLNLFRNNRADMMRTLGPVFLACFSVARDADSQWLAYGESGGGLCLGLEVLDEEEGAHLPVAVLLSPVVYSREQSRRRVERGLRGICDKLAQFRGKCKRQEKQALSLALNAMYVVGTFAAVTAKKPGWASEKEWRLIAFAKKGHCIHIRKRESCGRRVRYISLPLRARSRPLALSEIIIGGPQEPGAARTKLMALLAKTGYPSRGVPCPRVAVSSSSASRLGRSMATQPAAPADARGPAQT